MKIRSLFIVCKQRFKSNIAQHLQLTLALIMTALSISLAQSLLWVADKPFDRTFEKLKASHLLLLFDNESYSDARLMEWFSNQNEVEFAGNSQPYTVVTAPFLLKGEKLDVDIQITERIVQDSVHDQLIVSSGTKKKHPELDEIWLPYHFEHIHGIALGDMLGIPTDVGFYEVKVTAFVIDPHYLSNVFNPSRAWVAPGQLSFFLPTKDLNNRTLGIRLKQSDSLDTVHKRFVKAFDYAGISLKSELFKSAYTGFSKLLSLILLIFGAVILLVSLMVIGTNVNNHILSETKQIGVLKSLGFSKWNVIGSFVFQSTMLLAISLPIGLLLSNACLGLLMRSTLSHLGITGLSFNSGPIYSATALLITILVLIISLTASFKAGKLKPMNALRNLDVRPSNPIQKFKLSIEGRFPLTSWISVHFIRASPSTSLLLTGAFLTTFLIMLFSTSMYRSFDELKENKTSWGFDESDFVLHRKSSIVLPLGHLELMEVLGKYQDTSIEQIIPYNHISLNLFHNEDEKEQVFGKVYAMDIDKSGLNNLTGKHPVSKNGVGLCTGTAKRLNKTVGDSVLVEIEGIKNRMVVSGIYQDISAFGQGIRLHQSAFIPFNPLFEPFTYGIKLKKDTDPKLLKEQLLNELGEAISVEGDVIERESIQGVVSSLKQGFIVVAILFILTCLVLISNDIVLHTQKNELVFSQLKTIGFTSLQLRFIVVQRIIILFNVSVILAIPIGISSMPFLANTLASGIGIGSFPLATSTYHTTITAGVLLLCILFTGWFSSSKLRKIDPRKLVEI